MNDMRTLTVGLVTLIATLNAHADGCATIYTRKNLVGTIFVSPAEGVSIEFPKPYRHYQITNSDLWYVDDAESGTPDNVLIIAPKLMGMSEQMSLVQYNGGQPLGPDQMTVLSQVMKKYQSSNLHVYAMDNALYTLKVKVADRHPACYTLIDTERPGHPPSDRKAGAEIQATDTRESVQHFIDNAYSHYTWSEPEGWRGSAIENVIDDGRFTYVRIKDANQGPMAVLATIDDRLVIVQHRFDASKRTYRIHGVFPEIRFKHGESSLTVKRGDP
jgi:hypothetical protein